MFGLVFMPNGRQTVGRVASVMAAVQVYMARSGSTYAGGATLGEVRVTHLLAAVEAVEDSLVDAR